MGGRNHKVFYWSPAPQARNTLLNNIEHKKKTRVRINIVIIYGFRNLCKTVHNKDEKVSVRDIYHVMGTDSILFYILCFFLLSTGSFQNIYIYIYILYLSFCSCSPMYMHNNLMSKIITHLYIKYFLQMVLVYFVRFI